MSTTQYKANETVSELPLSGSCESIAGNGHHALVAVSLFNSYYNWPRVQELIEWARGRFSNFHVPVFDAPHAYTLAASGYTVDRAVRRALEEGRRMHRKLQNFLLDRGEQEQADRILTWSNLSSNPRYQTLSLSVERAFHSDARFREACLDMAAQFVKGRCLENSSDRPDATSYGVASDTLVSVRYLLSELPLFMDTAGILGVQSSTFCYHRSYEFYERFFNHEFSIGPMQGQAFLVVKFPGDRR